MKAVREAAEGFVEITLRASVYKRLVSVLERYGRCEESSADSIWLEKFVRDLRRRDAEDVGVN